MTKAAIAILGPGAVGGFLASVLKRAGNDVVCIASNQVAAGIKQDGIRLESGIFGNFVARPRSASRLQESPEFLLITVKATGLSEALDRVDSGLVKETVIVPFLNGIEHMEVLRRRFGPRVIAGAISIEVFRRSPQYAVHSSPSARITLASDNGLLRPATEDALNLFRSAGLETGRGESEAQILWEKLIRLNALACATTVSGKTIGELRGDPYSRKALESLVAEACAVAAAEGVLLYPAESMAYFDAMGTGQRSSMHRDFVAGKALELDAIAGAIIRRAEKNGIACPTINRFIDEIESRLH